MNGRIVCPHCHRSIPGAKRIGITIAVEYSRSHITYETGTLPCPCGAQLIIVRGAVAEYAPPAIKARVVERSAMPDPYQVVPMEVV